MSVLQQKQPTNSSDKSTIGVLLLHGLTGAPSEMKPIVQALRAQGCRVEVPLLAGHGGTHEDLLATTWQDWLNSARDAIVQLRKDCEQIFVCGLSMSTLLAVHLATEMPGLFSPTYAICIKIWIHFNFCCP